MDQDSSSSPQGAEKVITRDVCVKGVIAGPASVGKTAIVSYLKKKKFDSDGSGETMGPQYEEMLFCSGDVRFKIELWDTAGQEKYANLNPYYYRGTNFLLLVFSIDSKESFDTVDSYLMDCLESNGKAENQIDVLVIGNKKDLVRFREVTAEKGAEYASKYNYEYLETSAKTGENIDKILPIICGKLAERVESLNKESTEEESLAEVIQVKRKKCC